LTGSFVIAGNHGPDDSVPPEAIAVFWKMDSSDMIYLDCSGNSTLKRTPLKIIMAAPSDYCDIGPLDHGQ
jgi:hypothetical protein